MRNEVGVAFDANNMYVSLASHVPIFSTQQNTCQGDSHSHELYPYCISEALKQRLTNLAGFGGLRIAEIILHDLERIST
jgi:hypothetical protein